MKPIITIDDFAKVELKVGLVKKCEKKEGSEKLLRLTVDFGEEGIKNILSGIAPWYAPEDLVEKQFVFVFNLAPRKMMGEESQSMILATDSEKPFLLQPLEKVAPGTSLR